eukprot:m.27016 g.27016  ORF g.27016 m.27016 type:complete len:1120 (+) comp4360_c0_seq1:36-3395(+)
MKRAREGEGEDPNSIAQRPRVDGVLPPSTFAPPAVASPVTVDVPVAEPATFAPVPFAPVLQPAVVPPPAPAPQMAEPVVAAPPQPLAEPVPAAAAPPSITVPATTMTQLAPAVTAATVAGNGTPPQAPYQRLKVEDALSYLDQVKLQFGNQPHVYNQFLEIMKEFKSQSIDTPGVIRRVQELFEGHNDLVVGFNTFLPPGYKMPEHGAPIARTTEPAHDGSFPPASSAEAPAARPGSPKQRLEFNHAINYVNKIKNRFANQLEIYKAFLEILHTYQKEQKSIQEVYNQVATLFSAHPDLLEEFSQFLPEAVPAAEAHAHAISRSQARAAPTRPTPEKKAAQPPKRAPQKPLDFQNSNLQELGFFEKVKKALRSETAYDNFLRCLNLYSHEIVGRSDLLMLLMPFLSPHPDLLAWFKTFVGHKDDPARVMDGLADASNGRIDLSQCKRLDTSYRALPSQFSKPLCTGRDKLRPEILETLNDSWVSFPAWSEDSAFLATKKNAYEEAIFRCEDERYELDVVLESNLSTIRQLERVMKEIQALPADQQKEYKLNTKNMHGASETIYRKAITRLYGDKVEDVFQAMRRDAVNAVPVVLRRLRQKQAEWRSAQRQWNRVWRDVNERNYLKSLDYKVSLFKRQDPLACKPKTLKQTMRDRRDAYRAYRQGTDPSRETVPPPIMEFTFQDPDVFQDVNRLLLFVINRGNFGADKGKMETLLQHFLPDFFFMEPFAIPVSTEPAAADAVPATGAPAAPADDQQAEPMAADGDSGGEGEGEAKAAAPRKPPCPIAAVMTRVQRQPPAQAATSTHLFYANGKWFGLHALYQILYERVWEIKTLCTQIAAHAKAAADRPPGDPPAAVALALRTVLETPPERYYDTFLESTERLLASQLELNAYEEQMREMFTTKAYKVFTLDKLVQSACRQLHALVTDPVAQALSGAYQRSLLWDPAYDYKAEVLTLLEDSNVFRIEQREPRHLVMELLDADMAGSDGDTKTERWMRYVERYVRLECTDPALEQAIASAKRPVFLKRNARRVGYADATAAMAGVIFNNMLECKICMNTYKMYFVIKSEDYFHRPHARRPVGPRKHLLEALPAAWKASVTPEMEARARDLFAGTAPAVAAQ